MKKVEHYICEVCNTEYKEKKSAERCEKSHKHPKSVTSGRYSPVTCSDGYPHTVEVLFDNGEMVRYKRG